MLYNDLTRRECRVRSPFVSGWLARCRKIAVYVGGRRFRLACIAHQPGGPIGRECGVTLFQSGGDAETAYWLLPRPRQVGAAALGAALFGVFERDYQRQAIAARQHRVAALDREGM